MVVAGHIDFTEIGSSFLSYLYTFNVAIFFFVSGFLWKNQHLNQFPKFLLSKFKSVLIPYFIFFCISLLYGHLVIKHFFHEYVIPFNLFDTARALLFGSEWLNSVPTFNFALWFLPIFFIANCCFYFLQLVRSRILFVLILICLICISIPVQQLIPGRPLLSINVLPVALTLMGAGYVWSKWLNNPPLKLYVVVLMLVFSLWVTALYPGNIAGINTLWYFPSAVVSILIYFRVAQDFRGSYLLRFLGAESLLIFGLHSLVANFYRFTPLNSFFSTYWSGLMLWLTNLLFVVGVTAAIVFFVKLLFRKAVKALNLANTQNK